MKLHGQARGILFNGQARWLARRAESRTENHSSTGYARGFLVRG